MIRKLRHAAVGAALAVACSIAAASADCVETVTHVVVHSSGNVYFMTDQTCSANWCEVNWGAGAKNGLAMLMTAQALGKKVEFQWPGITACTQPNVIFASPDYFSTSQ